MNLDFDVLFKEAMEQWPEKIDLHSLQNVSHDYGRYAVSGMTSEISDLYIGVDGEVIIRTLQSVLYQIVHRLAKNVVYINRDQIRKEFAKHAFEAALRSSMESNDLNWEPDDFALAERYFKQNYTKA